MQLYTSIKRYSSTVLVGIALKFCAPPEIPPLKVVLEIFYATKITFTE